MIKFLNRDILRIVTSHYQTQLKQNNNDYETTAHGIQIRRKNLSQERIV